MSSISALASLTATQPTSATNSPGTSSANPTQASSDAQKFSALLAQLLDGASQPHKHHHHPHPQNAAPSTASQSSSSGSAAQLLSALPGADDEAESATPAAASVNILA